jgi:hypothetical protein
VGATSIPLALQTPAALKEAEACQEKANYGNENRGFDCDWQILIYWAIVIDG